MWVCGYVGWKDRVDPLRPPRRPLTGNVISESSLAAEDETRLALGCREAGVVPTYLRDVANRVRLGDAYLLSASPFTARPRDTGCEIRQADSLAQCQTLSLQKCTRAVSRAVSSNYALDFGRRKADNWPVTSNRTRFCLFQNEADLTSTVLLCGGAWFRRGG